MLHGILTASHHIHYQSQARRKHYLYVLLAEHGVWHHGGASAEHTGIGMWKDLIEEVIAMKVQEAARRKARKEAMSQAAASNSSGTSVAAQEVESEMSLGR